MSSSVIGLRRAATSFFWNSSFASPAPLAASSMRRSPTITSRTLRRFWYRSWVTRARSAGIDRLPAVVQILEGDAPAADFGDHRFLRLRRRRRLLRGRGFSVGTGQAAQEDQRAAQDCLHLHRLPSFGVPGRTGGVGRAVGRTRVITDAAPDREWRILRKARVIKGAAAQVERRPGGLDDPTLGAAGAQPHGICGSRHLLRSFPEKGVGSISRFCVLGGWRCRTVRPMGQTLSEQGLLK